MTIELLRLSWLDAAGYLVLVALAAACVSGCLLLMLISLRAMARAITHMMHRDGRP